MALLHLRAELEAKWPSNATGWHLYPTLYLQIKPLQMELS